MAVRRLLLAQSRCVLEPCGHTQSFIEDTYGATIGTAAGAGIAIVVAALIPILSMIVPAGALIGGLGGILKKEMQQRNRKAQMANSHSE